MKKRLIKKSFLEIGNSGTMEDAGFNSQGYGYVDVNNRNKAIVYINGEIKSGESHPEILQWYINDEKDTWDTSFNRDKFNTGDSIGFAHLITINNDETEEQEKAVVIETITLENLTIDEFKQSIMQQYGNIQIFTTDENPHGNIDENSDYIGDYTLTRINKLKDL